MLALTLLTGCGLNGDFGRMRTSLQSDDTHAWLGPAVYRPAVQPPWKHQLTDDERRLRDYAYPLIDPPYDRNQWLSALDPLFGPQRAQAARLALTAHPRQHGRPVRRFDASHLVVG